MQQEEIQASGNDEDINLTYFVQLLPLGEENYKDYEAQTRREAIVQLSNLLKTIGNRINSAHREHFSDFGLWFFGSVTKTIDVVLTWYFIKEVEQNKDYKKNECVLRGLFHYAVIGSYATLFPLLKIMCKSMDVAINPFKSIYKDIKANLAKVEAQHNKVCILLEKAGVILKEMIVEDAFDQTKAKNFDITVKEATGLLEESKGYLKLAQKFTSELMEVMTIIKWFSRIVLLGGCALTCFALYQLKPSSLNKLQDVLPLSVSVSPLSVLPLSVSPPCVHHLPEKCLADVHPLCNQNRMYIHLCGLSFGVLVSLYQSQTYEIFKLLDNLNDLKKEHGRLEMELHNLQKQLVEKKEEIDGLKKKKTTL